MVDVILGIVILAYLIAAVLTTINFFRKGKVSPELEKDLEEFRKTCQEARVTIDEATKIVEKVNEVNRRTK